MSLPILKCDYCGIILETRGNLYIDCGCPASVQARAVEREQAKHFAAAQKITFDEARQKNKVPIRGK